MLFSREKEDDDDFVPNPSYSNLASIFGSSGGGGENTSSLTYTPPKQPRRQNKPSTIAAPSSSSRSSSLLCAKTVQTFKMLDGAYQNQGKVGAAVLSFASDEGMSYQILLYRDKQNHLCNARITREFNFHIQPKNYCTFYDKQNVIWSMLFDSPADMAEFNLQVAKCRWKSEQSTNPILIQELWCPVMNGEASKVSASVGDTVELTYTLTTINSISEEVEELQRVVVEVEASGWKQALVGVQLNSQRVIILQPFMLGDLNPSEVVYNSSVVVKFTVLQVSKAPPPPEPSSTQKLAFHNAPVSEETRDEVEAPPKPEPVLLDNSDQKTTESPRSPKSTKADLINRMARMGQALPFKKVAPVPSDSDETEEDHKTQVQRFGKVVPKPRSRVQHTTPSLMSVENTGDGESPSLNTPVPVIPQVPMQWPPGIQPYMVGNMYPVPQVNSPMDSQAQFNMFLSEVRTTNSELRMGLTRLTDKVENLQTKVEDSKKTHSSEDVNTILERLMEGEQQLKDQLQQVLTTLQTTQLTSQSRTSGEVAAQPQAQPAHVALDTPSVTSCQKCAELQQFHKSLSERIEKLQEENELLQVNLTAQKDALFNAKIADKDQLSQIETFQRQLSEEQRNVSELKNSLESLQRVKETLAEDLQTANNSITELQETLQEKQMNIDKLEQTLRESEATKLEEVRRNLQEVLDPRPVITEHVKKIFNAVYRLVRVQFQPQGKYDANFIQSVLAETIKGVTLEYLQNGDLWSSGRATPAVSVQSVPDASGQAKLEEFRTLYMDREQRASTDTDCKSAIASSLISGSSESSLISPKTSENKVTEINSVEEKSSGNQLADIPIDNKIPPDPPSSVADTADDSSDDGKSLVSVKLETVLLHLSQSQSKMSDPLPSSSPWHHSLPQPQSKMSDPLSSSSSSWHTSLPQSHPFFQFLKE